MWVAGEAAEGEYWLPGAVAPDGSSEAEGVEHRTPVPSEGEVVEYQLGRHGNRSSAVEAEEEPIRD